MEGTMTGTSIQDLPRKSRRGGYDDIRNLQEMNQTKYNAGQNMHYEQGHNAAHHMHQAQHMPYYQSQGNNDYPQFINNGNGNQYPGYLTPQKAQEAVDIEELAKEINNNLGEDTFSTGSDNNEDASGSIKQTIVGSIPEIIREPLLLLIIYIILSQPIVRETLGQYIQQLNPDMEGKVSFTGVLIYGIILATLYTVAKRFIL